MSLVNGLGRHLDAALHGDLRQILIGRLGVLQVSQNERPTERHAVKLPLPHDDTARLGGRLSDIPEKPLQRGSNLGYNPHGKFLLPNHRVLS